MKLEEAAETSFRGLFICGSLAKRVPERHARWLPRSQSGGAPLVPVRALLTNTGDREVMVRDCYEVEKWVDGAWVVGYTNNACLLEMTGLRIAPGEDFRLARDLVENVHGEGGTAFPHGLAGLYRIRLEVGTIVEGNWLSVPDEQRTFLFDVVE